MESTEKEIEYLREKLLELAESVGRSVVTIDKLTDYVGKFETRFDEHSAAIEFELKQLKEKK